MYASSDVAASSSFSTVICVLVPAWRFSMIGVIDASDRFLFGTLEPIARVGRGAHLALAVFVGRTRLIDNTRL